MSDQIEKIRAVKLKYEKSWMALEGIVAVGIGKTSAGKTGIIVSVKEDVKKYRRKIADEIEGVPVEIQETGEIKAF